MRRIENELRSLMIAAQEGDGGAFKRLLQSLRRPLWGYVAGQLTCLGHNGSEAEDILQEVLIAIHKHRHTYDPAQRFTPWAYGIARYKLLDHLRRSRAAMAALPLETAGEMATEDYLGALESRVDAERLRAILPVHSRRAMKEVKLDGLSIAESAQGHGISEAAMKVRIHRGLKAMAAALKLES